MIYSAHDDQITNIMLWLDATNLEVDYVIYASQVVLELRADSECLTSTNDETCFRVGARYNGNELAFDFCAGSAQPDGTGCSYSDFLSYMDEIWFY
jgi:hypothetical protein